MTYTRRCNVTRRCEATLKAQEVNADKMFPWNINGLGHFMMLTLGMQSNLI